MNSFLRRFCLGYNLAMAEMKVFLALFARRVDYDLVNQSADHVTWKKASIIPKPKDGAVISVKSLV
jgi:cytochrome P450